MSVEHRTLRSQVLACWLEANFLGTQKITACSDDNRAQYLRAILDDLAALAAMLEGDLFDDELRIGAEQEYWLVDARMNPAPICDEVIRLLADARYTVELGRFNLEANLTPRRFEGSCLKELERELDALSGAARKACHSLGAELLVTGILPTYDALHARGDQMTPSPRFERFEAASIASRGGAIPLVLQGKDTLNLCHDNIMLEAGPTSFQLHLQVTPRQFASAFNAALVLAGPLVAASANAPLLGGQRLWQETRIPLLERSADLRTGSQWRRGGRSRTSLGDGFVESSVVEIYRRDLATFVPVLAAVSATSPIETLRAGRIPKLEALSAFNGSVWRWVRPCYGVTDGKPHLRIENRVLSAGPSLKDEIASAAFWLGLMVALPSRFGDVRHLVDYAEVEANFHAAAREGLDATLRWIDGGKVSARTLILEELLPMAHEGLRSMNVDAEETLSTFEARVDASRTGASWMLERFEALPSSLSPRARAFHVTRELIEHCWSGRAVHEWPVNRAPSAHVEPSLWTACRSEFMTIAPDAPVELAAFLLSDAKEDEPLVVEDSEGRPLGVLHRRDVADAATGGVVRDALSTDTPVLELPMTLGEAISALAFAGTTTGLVLDDGRAMAIVKLSELVALKHAPAPGSWAEPAAEAVPL